MADRLPYDPTIHPTCWLIQAGCERKWPGLSVQEKAKLLHEILPTKTPVNVIRQWLEGTRDLTKMRLGQWLEVVRVLRLSVLTLEMQGADLDDVGQVLPHTKAIRDFVFSVLPAPKNDANSRWRWWNLEILPALIACGAVNERRAEVGKVVTWQSKRSRFYSTTERVLAGLRVILQPDATPPQLEERWRRYRVELAERLEERKLFSARAMAWWGPLGLARRQEKLSDIAKKLHPEMRLKREVQRKRYIRGALTELPHIGKESPDDPEPDRG